jgi:hypothetical protein
MFGESTAEKMVAVVGDELVRRPLNAIVRLDPDVTLMTEQGRGEELRLLRQLADHFCPAEQPQSLQDPNL